MSFLDSFLARYGYTKADSAQHKAALKTAYDKGYADGERDALHPLDPPLDVVLVTHEETTVCIMDADDYAELTRHWTYAVQYKAEGSRAGCYWMTVDGQRVNRGLILTDITSIVGVPATPKAEGDA